MFDFSGRCIFPYACATVALLACNPPPPDSYDASPSDADEPNDAGDPSERSPFGILGVVSIQAGVDGGTEDVRERELFFDLGVKWMRNDPVAKYVAPVSTEEPSTRYQSLDEYIRSFVVEKHVHPLLTFSVVQYAEQGQPVDLERYSRWVEQTVERYDGDGIDDMNGSPRVSAWAIGANEPDNGVTKSSVYSIDNLYPYIDVGCQALKRACPDCRAVLGGAGSSEAAFTRQGETVTKPNGQIVTASQDGYYVELLKRLQASPCRIDAVDYHYWTPALATGYQGHRRLNKKINALVASLALPQMELWTTEGGSFEAGLPGVNLTEADQAHDVLKRYVYAIAHGQKKLFWTKIVEYDWTRDDSNFFDFTGLVNNPRNQDNSSSPKLAYFAFKKMVEMLDGADWAGLHLVYESDGVLAYRLERDGKSIYVAWNDNSDIRSLVLMGVAGSQLRVVDGVPNVAQGADVSDYATAFPTEIRPVINGSVQLTLKASPVIAEPLQ